MTNSATSTKSSEASRPAGGSGFHAWQFFILASLVGATVVVMVSPPGTHPIAPIMLGDAALAAKFADTMLERGVYVIGFSYPVVPKGKARIRTQISAAHSREDLEFALEAFSETKRELGL